MSNLKELFFPQVFDQHGQKIETSYIHECGVAYTESSQEYFDGKITNILTADKILMMAIDLQAHKDLKFKPYAGKYVKTGLSLIFNAADDFVVETGNSYKLEQESIGILLTNLQADLKLSIKANSKVRLINIYADIKALIANNYCSEEQVPSHITKFLEQAEANKVHRKIMSADVLELMRKCFCNDKAGLELKLNHESICKDLTARGLMMLGRNKATYHTLVRNLHAKDREIIHQVANLLEQNYSNPPKINDLAKKVGMNKNKLSAGFQAIYGMTINKYLLKIRLEKAKSLLQNNPEMTVIETAENIGYNNASYFIRKFKSQYGRNPGEFQNSLAENK